MIFTQLAVLVVTPSFYGLALAQRSKISETEAAEFAGISELDRIFTRVNARIIAEAPSVETHDH